MYKENKANNSNSITEGHILDQILSSKKNEDIIQFSPSETIEKLFSDLSHREQDILIRRYGLMGKKEETLENIGKTHDITRERVRQIAIGSIQKIKNSKNFDGNIKVIKNIIIEILEKLGESVSEDFLVSRILNYFIKQSISREDSSVGERNLKFILEAFLKDSNLIKIEETANTNSYWMLSISSAQKVEETCGELEKMIEKIGSTIETDNLLNNFKSLEYYATIKNVANPLTFTDRYQDGQSLVDDIINQKKYSSEDRVLLTLFRISKKVKQNKFGTWGLKNWSTITPRRMNDKIFLVLKKEGRPMHFAQLAQKINENKFDNKKANAATVHNELIMDGKYVLVGRGIYALKSWGYKKGTVSDVIKEIMAKERKPLNKKEIIEMVLEQRIVKKATIHIALLNKRIFEKNSNGEFFLTKGE